MGQGGAYCLHICLSRRAEIEVGRKGPQTFAAGLYLYVGSARRGLQARVDRHSRLAEQKGGRLHWHVDYLLVHPHSRLQGVKLYENGDECAISASLTEKGFRTPIIGFGASDCTAGCSSHLYYAGRRCKDPVIAKEA